MSFPAPHCQYAGGAQGFVCVLDFRDSHGGIRKASAIGHWLAWAALLALAAYCAEDCLSPEPAEPLPSDEHATQPAGWDLHAGFPPNPNLQPNSLH